MATDVVVCSEIRRSPCAGRLFSLVLVAASLTGCTLVSVGLSPLTGPVDAVRAAVEGDIPSTKIWVVPILIILSPLGGLFAGLKVDEAVVTQGRWDVIPAILRPWTTSVNKGLPPLYAKPAVEGTRP